MGRNISIHALLAESDICVCWTAPSRQLFLSTLSLRRATEQAPYRVVETQISIHALLAESDSIPKPGKVKVVISIHALLAESDRIEPVQVPG